jgi:alkylhydroperoxidase/carboxymuconolactone decarboxylase family protein YurZ
MSHASTATGPQRTYVELLRQYQPDLCRRWGAELDRAVSARRLDTRTEALMVTGVCALVHWAAPRIRQEINRALDAGSNVAEVVEILVRLGAQEGVHALSSGGEALWDVVAERRADGRPVPVRGDPLGPDDLLPHLPMEPAVFPYHTPWPRHWASVLTEFVPERAAVQDARAAELAALPRAMSRRLQEVFDVAVDSVIRWKEPRIDHHAHEALNCGSSVQELLEVVLVSAEAAQGARDSTISGRSVETGMAILAHGLACLDRVKQEREQVGMYTPMDYGQEVRANDPRLVVNHGR